MRYVPRPVEIEALEWKGGQQCYEAMREKWPEFAGVCKIVAETTLVIRMAERELFAVISDFIIKGTEGEFYPCKAKVFRKKYKRAPAAKK